MGEMGVKGGAWGVEVAETGGLERRSDTTGSGRCARERIHRLQEGIGTERLVPELGLDPVPGRPARRHQPPSVLGLADLDSALLNHLRRPRGCAWRGSQRE